MKPSPCLNPIRVFNKTLNTYLNVPCGHCDACICSKGFHLSERLREALALYTHKYFVTLTFSDEYLPVARYDEVLDCYVHPYDSDYNGVTYNVSSDVVKKSLSNVDFQNSFTKYKGVPVLSRRISILFKKRLRKHFSKLYDEKLFIFIVGEYGPSTLRPHYHLLLGTNASVNASILEGCVHKSWSEYDKIEQKFISEYGRIDFQRVITKGCRNYVAQYLNCFTALPPVYSTGHFRPFYQSSSFCDSDICRYKNSSLREVFFNCSPKTTCISNEDNSVTNVYLPSFIQNRVFPKLYQYHKLSYWNRVELYGLFEKCKNLRAEEFAECVINGFHGRDCFSLAKFLCYDSNDYILSVNRLKKLFYISRRVCFNCSSLNISLEQYVKHIEIFWSRYELSKLADFYELQKSLLDDRYHPVSLKDLFTLYYNTDDNISNLNYYIAQFGYPDYNNKVSNISLQVSYFNLMHKILLDTSKTKKRNDYFVKNHFKKPSFISKLKIKKSWLEYSRI